VSRNNYGGGNGLDSGHVIRCRVRPASVVAEYEAAGREFHRLLDTLSPEEFDGPSIGTKWSNEQLLFHMLFGYMILRALQWLVRVVSRMPKPVGRGFARLLNWSTPPFDVIN
jgi:hypothetical protein